MTKVREDFVKKYGALAVKVTAGTGIFPEVLLSQAIVESSRNGIPGASQLSKKYYNFFGIKDYPAWKGKTVNFKTGEVFNGNRVTINSNFCAYDSVEDGFKGYVDFLQKNPRYTKAGVFTAKTIAQQIQALKAAGYATDPQYITVVNSIANQIKRWLGDAPASSILGTVVGGFLVGTFFF